MKNIPIGSERSYKLQLVEKIEQVIRIMRWKAMFTNVKHNKEENTERYGLKYLYCPKQARELLVFENDLIALVKNIKFRKYNNSFQTKLNKDIKLLRNSNKTLTFADKTTNLYLLTKEEHDKLLQNAITSKYKKVARKIKDKIKKGGKRILNDKDLVKRLHINGYSNCFITMKDHKENFGNKPSVRLINLAKNQIGRISKVILDKINVVN